MSSDPFHPPAWQSADGRHFYVFVYGTLRRGEINDIVLAAERHGIAEPTLMGTARLPGRLFDYGEWPGILPLDSPDCSVEQGEGTARHAAVPAAVHEAASDTVTDSGFLTNDDPLLSGPTVLGDVFYAPMALLAVLDDIEGIQEHSRGAFYRVPCALRMGSGETLNCVYYPVDESSTVSCSPIAGGDWIAHRMAKTVTSRSFD